MRIVLTKIGKKELTIENDRRSVDANVRKKLKNQQRQESANKTKKYRHLLLGLQSNSINNNNQHIVDTESDSNRMNSIKNKINKSKILSIAGQESINNNFNAKRNKSLNMYKGRNDSNIPPYQIIDIHSKNCSEIKKFYDKKKDDEDEKNSNENNDNNNNKNVNQSIIAKSGTDSNLPSIQFGLPLKNVLASKNKEKVNESLLEKEISGSSLIDYLKSDKTIYPSFLEKINKANDQQLFKLDKVCKIYFNNEIENNSIKNHIQNKIKNEYFKDALYFKNSLKNMSNDLKGIENSYNNLRLHKNHFDYKKTSILKRRNCGIKKEDCKISK